MLEKKTKYTKDKNCRASLRMSLVVKLEIDKKYGSVQKYFTKKTDREFAKAIRDSKK